MSIKATATPPPAEPPEPLAGTVKPYQQHLAICTGGPPEWWHARVEEMEGVFAALYAALEARSLHHSIKLTACDVPSTGAEGFDILLMPDMLVLPEITLDKVDSLAEALAHQFTRGLPFDVRPMPGGDHVFVCVHGNRDERCGRWGKPFFLALQREVAEQNAIAHVHQTSHIGGHRYAATCIVYPQGIWYGDLRPDDAPRLVAQHLIAERLLPEHYRGRLGISSCHQVAEAEAARVLMGAHPEYESLSVTVQEAGQRAHAVARARVPGPNGPFTVTATFNMACPLVWWSADEEPVFASEHLPKP